MRGLLLPPRRSWPALLLILAAGGAVRGWLMPIDGHKGDLCLFWQWSDALRQGGMGQVYRRGELPEDDPGRIEPCNYPPLYLYMLAGAATVAERTGFIADYAYPAVPDVTGRPRILLVLKSPALAADLAACLLIYGFWRRLGLRRAGLAAAAAYALFPPVIYDAAMWGQSDTVLAALLCLVLVTALDGRGWLAGGGVAACLLLKPQGVLAVPIWLVAMLLRCTPRALGERDAGTAMIGTNTDTAEAAVPRRNGYHWRAGLGALLVGGMIALPAIMGGGGRSLLKVYTGSVGSHTNVTVAAFNGWYVWSGPGVFAADVRRRTDDRRPVVAGITYRHVGLAAFAAVVTATLAAAALRPRDPRVGPIRSGPCVSSRGVPLPCRQWLAAHGSQSRGIPPMGQTVSHAPVYAFVICWSFFMLNTEMHERYGVPALIFMAMAVPLGARFGVMYGLLAITQVWNLGIVFAYPSTVFGGFVRRAMGWPKSSQFAELGFGLAVINLAVLIWCLLILWGARRRSGGTGPIRPGSVGACVRDTGTQPGRHGPAESGEV